MKLIFNFSPLQIITGTWSNIAAQDAEIFGKVNRVIPPLAKGQNAPDLSDLKLSENASYFYYCANETIEGTYNYTFVYVGISCIKALVQLCK